MPVFTLTTNVELATPARAALLAAASRETARLLGKPESYVLTSLHLNPDMRFAGTSAPLAYLEFKSIGLPRSQTPALAAALCDLVTTHLGIAADRVYIEFADAEASMWGWNRDTF